MEGPNTLIRVPLAAAVGAEAGNLQEAAVPLAAAVGAEAGAAEDQQPQELDIGYALLLSLVEGNRPTTLTLDSLEDIEGDLELADAQVDIKVFKNYINLVLTQNLNTLSEEIR